MVASTSRFATLNRRYSTRLVITIIVSMLTLVSPVVATSGHVSAGISQVQQVLARRAARRVAREAMVRIQEMMEEPELYYDEEGDGMGSRWIWSASSSVPRDVLSAERRPPQMSVVVTVDDVVDMLGSFDEFVEHYRRLGVDGSRLVFDVRRHGGPDGSDGDASDTAHARLARMIEAAGSEYSTTFIAEQEEEEIKSTETTSGYISLMEAMRGLPLNDWILMVHQSDRLRVRAGSTRRRSAEAAIWEFLDGCERDGINSVWGSRGSCEFGRGELLSDTEGRDDEEDREDDPRVVAVRGFLRPDPTMRRVLSLRDAESLFNGSFYMSYSPYFKFWELYKSPSVVGNAFLWSPRGSKSDPRLCLGTSDN